MDVYSVSEAAQLMGISVRRVRQLLEQGRIKGKRLGRDWVVLELGYETLHNYPGRQPKQVKKEEQNNEKN